MLEKPAKTLEKFLPLFEKQRNKVVLDYGSGNLRNSIFLQRRGYQVYAVDLPHRTQIKSLPRLNCILPEEVSSLEFEVDVTLCTFVLNLITSEERNRFLDTISRKMSRGGFFLLETKGFKLLELDAMIIPRGFVRVFQDRGRYTIIALYQYIGMLQ